MQIDEEYFENDDFKEKLRAYEKATEEGESIYMDEEDMADIIDYYTFKKEFDKAGRTADYALSMYPGSVGPLVFKIRRALDAHDAPTAYALANQIGDKSQVEYSYIRAEIEVAQSYTMHAEDILERRFELEEDDEDRDDYCLDCADLYLDYAEFDMASRWLEKCTDTENPDFQELAIRYAHGVRNYGTAEALLNKLIDLNPYKYKYWNMMSEVQADAGKFSEAVTSSEYSLAISPDNFEGMICQIRGLVALENMSKAMALAWRAADIHRYEPSLYSKVMALLIDKGYPNVAYEFFKFHTSNKRPKNMYFGYSYMAIACYEMGKKDEFEKNLKIAIEHNIEEVKVAMGNIIPEYLHEHDYFEYIINFVKNRTNWNSSQPSLDM